MLNENSLQPQSIDQSGERCRLPPSARVVKKETGERLAPIFLHPHKVAAFEMWFDALIGHEGEADSINRGADHSLNIINDQGRFTATDNPPGRG